MLRLSRSPLVRAAALGLTLAVPTATPRAQDSRVIRVPSAALGETRVVHLHLPEGYGMAKRRYPVVVLLDGQVKAFNDITVASAGYELTGAQHPIAMPSQIVVAVEQGDRSDDLVRREDAFLRFLTDELLPKVDKDFRTAPFRTLIGHSLGGRFALGAMCRAGAAFPAVIAISPSLPDSLLDATVQCARRETSTAPRWLVVSAGTLETRSLANADRLLAALAPVRPATWRITRVDAPGLDHTGAPLITIPMGLRAVFSDSLWRLPAPFADSLAKRVGDADAVLEHGVATRDRAFQVPRGTSLGTTPDEQALAVRAWLGNRNGERAVASARGYNNRFPEVMHGYTLLIDAYDAAGNQAEARRAIESAISNANRVPWFDETQKARFVLQMRKALAERTPR
ncbi:MAG TPA: alpha/beta hydrolase-fold protein [Gemmatimonas sp.]|uniref:alpha/beta hydrolase n=1 Tax=Gemmatimonas sp. TaxID=1962908 RepID=UPI002ED966E0